MSRPGAAGGGQCALVVCRGCCCGNTRKHPGDDHDAQLDRMREAADESGGRFTVRTTDCLGPCGQANVVVLIPSRDGRQRGGQAAWIGWAMGEACTEDILLWAAEGGPGIAKPPPALELQLIRPAGEARSRTRGRGRGRSGR